MRTGHGTKEDHRSDQTEGRRRQRQAFEVTLRPPVEPMLAQAAEAIPPSGALRNVA